MRQEAGGSVCPERKSSDFKRKGIPNKKAAAAAASDRQAPLTRKTLHPVTIS